MARRIDQGVNTVSPEQFLKFMSELIVSDKDIAKATEVLAAARGVKAGVFRRAKESGADLDAMRLLLKLSQSDDDDRNRLIENTYKYAEWSGVKLWVLPTEERPQGALFADDPEAQAAHQGLQDARITSDAFNSRRAVGNREANPHAPGSRDHQTWDQAWLDADRDIQALPDAKVRVASTAPRGRPPKKAAAPESNVVQAFKGKKPAPKALPAPTLREGDKDFDKLH